MSVLIKMSNIAKDVLSEQDILAYRHNGIKVRPRIEELINNDAQFQTFILDFQGIKLSDTSFLDETVVELTAHCQGHRYGEKLVATANLSEATVENLYSAILYRAEVKNQKVPVIDWSPRQYKIISALEESLLEVLDLAFKNKKITAVELEKMLNIELNSASMRLKRLYDYGFLFREGELVGNGKRFNYYPIGK